MKFFLLIFLLSCGKEDKQREMCAVYGEDCHANQKTTEPDSTSSGQPGPPGKTGPSGPQGEAGSSGANVVFDISNYSSCPGGGKTLLVALDKDRDGLLNPLFDSDFKSLEVCNGLNGQDGQDGQDGANGEDAPQSDFTPVSIEDPCGDASNVYDEVFLRLAGGQLLWSLSDNSSGTNTRFSLAVPGNWVTTDGSLCYFTVDSNFNILNEHY